jgi:hypothetical protein
MNLYCISRWPFVCFMMTMSLNMFSSPLSARVPSDCRERPGGGEPICTPISISGATEEGLNFAEYASCAVVRTQRPFRPVPVPNRSQPNDPRLSDPEFQAELAWLTQQVRSTGCACCHDSSTGYQAAMWDVAQGTIWTDQLTVRGIGVLSGRISSKIFGFIPPEENNGFDRSVTGLPTNQLTRMKAFFDREIERLGITEEMFKKQRPIGIGS